MPVPGGGAVSSFGGGGGCESDVEMYWKTDWMVDSIDGTAAFGSVLTFNGCSDGSVFCCEVLAAFLATVGLVGGEATLELRSGKGAIFVWSLGRDEGTDVPGVTPVLIERVRIAMLHLFFDDAGD